MNFPDVSSRSWLNWHVLWSKDGVLLGAGNDQIDTHAVWSPWNGMDGFKPYTTLTICACILYICMYMRVYIYIYTYMYVYIYIYAHRITYKYIISHKWGYSIRRLCHAYPGVLGYPHDFGNLQLCAHQRTNPYARGLTGDWKIYRVNHLILKHLKGTLWLDIHTYMYIYGGFLKWGYPQFSSILGRIFHYKPTSYWDITIYGNHHIFHDNLDFDLVIF